MLKEKIKNFKDKKKKKKYMKLLKQMKKDVTEIKKLEEELNMGKLELSGGDLKMKQEVPNTVPEPPQEMVQQVAQPQPVQPMPPQIQPTMDIPPMQRVQQPIIDSPSLEEPVAEENIIIRLELINGANLDVPVDRENVASYITQIRRLIVGEVPFLDVEGKTLNSRSIVMFEVLVSE